MNTDSPPRRIIAGALLTGAVVVAGLGLASGTAQAHNPHNWCPGDPMTYPTGPGPASSWDMNICHTWFWVKNGKGNVPFNGHLPSSLWDGDTPPPDSEPPAAQTCSPAGPVTVRGVRKIVGPAVAAGNQPLGHPENLAELRN